jgi:hypothetical protein
MRRRKFITLVSSTAVVSLACWPRSAPAQQSAKISRIGIIDDSPIWNAFRQGLRDLGYVEARARTLPSSIATPAGCPIGWRGLQ